MKNLPVLLLLVLFFCPFADAVSKAHKNAAERYFKHATTYYWLGIADKGDPGAFQTSLDYIGKALFSTSLIDGEDCQEAEILEMKIMLLNNDVKEQLAIARNNFTGRFPLARFIGESVFLRSDAFGTYEIATPPGELAPARATNAIGSIINQGLWGEAQLPMFVFSKNNDLPGMESATRVMLKNWHRVKVYENAHLANLADVSRLDAFDKALAVNIAQKALEEFGTSHIAFTFIELVDQVDDVLFYKFSCNIYAAGHSEPAQSIVHYELVRDKRYIQPWLLGMFLFFVILSAGLFYFLNIRRSESKPQPWVYVILPLLAWLIGIASSMIVFSVLATIKPGYQEYISYSFWWLPLAFLATFFASLVLMRKIIIMSPWIKKLMGNSEESASLYVIASFGITSLLGFGHMLYHHTESILFIVATAYFLGISAYAFGKVLDKYNPLPILSALPFAVLIPVGAILTAGISAFSVYVLLAVTASMHVIYLKYSKKDSGVMPDDEEQHESSDMLALPKNTNEFINRINNTPFFETNALKELMSACDMPEEGEPNIFCLVGKDGIGKTTTAREIIRQVKSNDHTDQDGRGVLVFKGYGEEQTGGTSPYFAVRQALKGFFGISPDEGSDFQTDEIDSLLDGVLKNVVPFSGLLFPDQKKNNATLSSQQEFFFSIATALKKLSVEKKVILFIDDIHWLDDASIDLLNYLHQFFKDKTGHPLLFLYTSRPVDKLIDLFATDQLVEMPAFSKKDYFDFLTQHFSLDKNSARLIMKWVSGHMAGKGNMFWLFKILDLLARGGHFKLQGNTFSLSEDLLLRQKLPIPDEYRLTIREELIKMEAHKKIIGLAAIVGIQFDASLIANALNMEKLDCLEALDMIERESNLVYDVTGKDGVFSFRSSFTLESIRLELGIFEVGRRQGRLRQIIKEYYAMVARSMEQLAGESEILKIAGCYANAGDAHAEKALPACIKAANHCIDLFRFDEARHYIKMAEEYIDIIEDKQTAETELTILKIRITTNEGKKHEVDEGCCSKQLQHPDKLSLQQLGHFAHFFYHTRKFARGLEIANMMLKRAVDPLDKAQAHFWRGLCLPLDAMQDKIAELEKALHDAEVAEHENIEALKLKSQVLNSLGELYGGLATKDSKHKFTAHKYLTESIELKSRSDIYDRAGLARSHGGLGRLELFCEPTDPKTALEHFEKDLELSEITGDYRGQVKMHSFIGACNTKLGNYEQAAASYKHSLKLSTDPVDAFFALLGLLEVSLHQTKLVDVEKVSEELKALMQEHALPGYCLDAIKSLVGKHPDVDYLKELS